LLQGIRVRLPAREADTACFDVEPSRGVGRLGDDAVDLPVRPQEHSHATSRRRTFAGQSGGTLEARDLGRSECERFSVLSLQ